MILEETMEIDLGDDPNVPKIVQFGKNLPTKELA